MERAEDRSNPADASKDILGLSRSQATLDLVGSANGKNVLRLACTMVVQNRGGYRWQQTKACKLNGDLTTAKVDPALHTIRTSGMLPS